MPQPTPQSTPPTPPQDPNAIFHDFSPIHPGFMIEAIRTLMRTLPLDDPNEPRHATYRRMHSATQALAALHPRDEIEVMLGVQTLAAYHAAAACWRIGMNLRQPHGDSTRHISTAASAARTFDTLLKALERRQAKPLAIPQGRPAPRAWPPANATAFIQDLEARCQRDETPPEPQTNPVAWSPEALATAHDLAERERIAQENEGLDLANTDGILPGGGMIMPQHPTPQQEAYIARRLALMYRQEIADNRRRGITTHPKIRPLRTGDHVP